MAGRIARLALAGAMVMAVTSMAAAPKKRGNVAATTRPAQKQEAKMVRGAIASVDIENKTLDVEVKRKQEMQMVKILTNEDTEFLLDGEVVTIVDLRAGMRVSFQPESGIATRVSAKTMTASEQKEFKEKNPPKATNEAK